MSFTKHSRTQSKTAVRVDWSLSSASPRLFSSGFDVREVFQYDRDEMTSFFSAFVDLIARLIRYPKPTVAAIGGHTYAGGAILALACDFRVMAAGTYRFALNEVNLGFAVPPSMTRMIENTIGTTHTRHLLLSGQPIDPAQARAMGVTTHQLVEPEGLRPTAEQLARELAEKAPQAYLAIKQSLRKTAEHPEDPVLRQEVSQFVEHWFSPAAQQLKEKLVQSMQRP